jgi:FKBP-type peptidyl-prolyl cis-trans isomerase FklB
VKTKLILSSLVALFILYTTQVAAAKPTTDKEKFSYALGFQVGQGFKRDGLDIDTQIMAQAIEEVLAGKDPQLTTDEMRGAMETAQQQLLAKRTEKAEKAQSAGEVFLAANKKKSGVKTLDSGLQYKVLKSGKGKQPTSTSTIIAHYKGELIDGSEFDSSYTRGEPATFGVNQVIKGWQEVLPLMHEGDKWQVVIPSALAYGERGSGASIGPNETLVFEIELIEVKKAEEKAEEKVEEKAEKTE